MQPPKLITYLRTFSKLDWKDFTVFSKSSYSISSSQAQVIAFYRKKTNYLFQIDWGREKLLQTVDPKITSHALANVLVKLTNIIEEYFVWQQTKEDENLHKSLLLKSLAQRSLKRDFFKLKEDFFYKKEQKNTDLWSDLYFLQVEHLTYFESMYKDVTHSRNILEKILDLSASFYDNLLNFYSVELTNREVTIQEDWSSERYKIKEISDQGQIAELSQKLISLKINRSHEDYIFLKEVLNKDKYFSREIRYTVLVHIISYLNNKIKNGALDYTKDLMSIYMFGLDSRILINNDSIPILRFYNILNIASGVKEFDWAENFIDKYADKVNSPHLEGIKLLAKAEINFNKGDFEKVIQSLVSNKYKNIHQELKARGLLLCSEFELNRDNIIFLEDRVRSMKYFLKRNENNLDVFTTKGMIEMCNFLTKLIKPYDKEKLKNEILKTEYLNFRPWLLNNIN